MIVGADIQLKFHYSPKPGYTCLVKPGDAGLRFIEFGILRLMAGEGYGVETAEREAVLVMLSGECQVTARDDEWAMRRKGIFQEKASAVYLPRHSSYRINGLGESEIAVAYALTDQDSSARLVTPDQVRVKRRGKPHYEREVHDIAENDFPARRLLVGETFTAPGQWSSYPPHKHDRHDPPNEYKLEEVYFYRVDPPQGFGLQRLYSDDGTFDQSFTVQDNDVIVFPKGYHPMAAAPGYTVYYLWVLAGETRTMSFRDDPAHAWVKDT